MTMSSAELGACGFLLQRSRSFLKFAIKKPQVPRSDRVRHCDNTHARGGAWRKKDHLGFDFEQGATINLPRALVQSWALSVCSPCFQ